jgi:hypothetical protein
LEDLGVDGTIILKCFYRDKQKDSTGFKWSRMIEWRVVVNGVNIPQVTVQTGNV